jgi:hypothetical protein
LMNRPIAINGNQGALCRPPEKILDLLDWFNLLSWLVLMIGFIILIADRSHQGQNLAR